MIFPLLYFIHLYFKFYSSSPNQFGESSLKSVKVNIGTDWGLPSFTERHEKAIHLFLGFTSKMLVTFETLGTI